MGEIDCKVEVLMKNITESVGEGPHYDPKRNELIFIDNITRTYFRYHLDSFKLEKIQADKADGSWDGVSMIMPCQGENEDYIVSQGLKLFKLNWPTKEMTELVKAQNYGVDDRFNDAKCDSKGRMWIGTMGGETSPGDVEKMTARLYCLERGKLTEHDKPFSISNGIAWSADFKTMYFVDSLPPNRCVFKYDYNLETGTVSSRVQFIDFAQWDFNDSGVPDGMTVDQDDNLWVAAYSGGKIIKFCGKTGKRLGHINIPGVRTTSCCFGGADHSTMFVVCAKHGWTEEEFQTKDPLAGSLFKVTGLGVRGVPAFAYKE